MGKEKASQGAAFSSWVRPVFAGFELVGAGVGKVAGRNARRNGGDPLKTKLRTAARAHDERLKADHGHCAQALRSILRHPSAPWSPLARLLASEVANMG